MQPISFPLVGGCQPEFSPSFEGKRSPITEDVKPNYLVNYGGVQPPTTTPEEKPSFDQYYPTKTNPIKPDPMKIPKTEMNTSSCCSVQGQGELLVPKTEITSTCRSPPSSIRSHYEPYLNQDSNSSSMSSMDTINSRSQHQIHSSGHMTQHHNQQPGYILSGIIWVQRHLTVPIPGILWNTKYTGLHTISRQCQKRCTTGNGLTPIWTSLSEME